MAADNDAPLRQKAKRLLDSTQAGRQMGGQFGLTGQPVPGPQFACVDGVNYLLR